MTLTLWGLLGRRHCDHYCKYPSVTLGYRTSELPNERVSGRKGVKQSLVERNHQHINRDGTKGKENTYNPFYFLCDRDNRCPPMQRYFIGDMLFLVSNVSPGPRGNARPDQVSTPNRDWLRKIGTI